MSSQNQKAITMKSLCNVYNSPSATITKKATKSENKVKSCAFPRNNSLFQEDFPTKN
jgi:hypothetical protein